MGRFCAELLSVGENWEYGFILPAGKLMKKIAEGECRADLETCGFAEENLEKYVQNISYRRRSGGSGPSGKVGEGEVWKSWLSIRTEDIEEFIKAEKW